jgi:nitrogen-specific signal transduction histidine kinase
MASDAANPATGILSFAAGEGSGLGLHIVKKIIDKHDGKIEIESSPGSTAFSVFIPTS